MLPEQESRARLVLKDTPRASSCPGRRSRWILQLATVGSLRGTRSPNLKPHTRTPPTQTVISTRRAEDRLIVRSKEAPMDLRASEERFGKVFAQAAVGMSLSNTKGRFLQVNDAFCNLHGFTRKELTETDSYAITHPEDRERYAAFTTQMLAGEINDYVIEKRCLKKDGSVVWVRKSVSLARDAAGEPSDIITLTEDITIRKHSEDALARRARLIALSADVGVALTRIGDLREALQSCVESVVKNVDAAARIW